MIKHFLGWSLGAMLSLPTALMADVQWRLGANFASIHINATRDYNEFNLGGFVSATWNQNGFLQYGIQAGAYNNSYSLPTTYVMGFADIALIETGPIEWRGGVWAGFFRYDNLVEKASAMGVPTIGNNIFLPGLSLTARTENFDISVRYLPFSTNKNNKGILTLQASVPIN